MTVKTAHRLIQIISVFFLRRPLISDLRPLFRFPPLPSPLPALRSSLLALLYSPFPQPRQKPRLLSREIRPSLFSENLAINLYVANQHLKPAQQGLAHDLSCLHIFIVCKRNPVGQSPRITLPRNRS